MVNNQPDTGVLRRPSSTSPSATPATAAPRSTAPRSTATGALKAPTTGPTLETAAPPLKITAAALEPASAALEVACKLLPARGTALGKSTRLSPIAGIEGRALRGEVAPPTSSGTLS